MDSAMERQIVLYISANEDKVGDLKKEFCDKWPEVVKGLEMIKNILKLIPGAAVAIPFIDGAISVGNAIQKAICL